MPIIKPSRRHILQLAAGGMAAPFIGGRALAQPTPYSGDLPVRAIGRPMPWGMRWPDTPPGPPAEGSVGIALVGLGDYGLKRIATALTPSSRCHLAGLVSGNPEKAQQVATAYGIPGDAIYSYDNFDQIAADDRIEAVYIALPTGLHAEWAENAFAAGKHVICEKPMALTPAECQRMIDASEAAGKKLMIGYRCHFEPHNIKAMALMRENAVGPIQVIRTDQQYNIGNTSPRDNWRVHRGLAGGGPLEDYGLYGLQGSLYLSNEMPVRVSASAHAPAGNPSFSQIYATVASEFTFPSGAVAQMATSYNADNVERIEVRGENGTLLMQPATSYGGQNMMLEDEKIEAGDPSVQFAAMLDHFGEAVRDGTPIKTGGEMGLRDMRLIDAIYTSVREKRSIALNPDATMAG